MISLDIMISLEPAEVKALDLAIKALETVGNSDKLGDLISRSALLDRIDEERKYLLERGQTGAEHILVHSFRDLVDNAPTVSDRYDEGYAQGYIDGQTGADYDERVRE